MASSISIFPPTAAKHKILLMSNGLLSCITVMNTFHFVMYISIIKGIRHVSTNLQTQRGIRCNSCKFIEQIDYCYLFCVLNV